MAFGGADQSDSGAANHARCSDVAARWGALDSVKANLADSPQNLVNFGNLKLDGNRATVAFAEGTQEAEPGGAQVCDNRVLHHILLKFRTKCLHTNPG